MEIFESPCKKVLKNVSAGVTVSHKNKRLAAAVLVPGFLLIMAIFSGSCRFPDKLVVSFNPKGGSPAFECQIIPPGGRIESVPSPTRSGFIFKGWYKDPPYFTKNWDFYDCLAWNDKTLYARWIPVRGCDGGGGGLPPPPGITEIIVPGKSVLNQLRWLHDQDIDGNDHVQGGPDRVYILRAHSQADLLAWGYAGGLEPTIPGNYAGINFGIDFPGRDYVYVRLIRYGGGPLNPRELRLGSLGTMLRIAPTNTLAIYDIDIIGWPGAANNHNPVMDVTGTLRLTNSEIRDNHGNGQAVAGIAGVSGSAVRVNPGGRFYMTNSRIRGNGGRGVVVDNGTFTMNAGAVVGATGLGGGNFDTDHNRGGVLVINGGFATMMSGSSIQGNISTQTAVSLGGGGGVRVHGGTFHMRGGAVITGNATEVNATQGGGVSVTGGGAFAAGGPFSYFRMYPGAIISYNRTTVTGAAGGGVVVNSGNIGNIGPHDGSSPTFYPATNTFNMLGGTITGNESIGPGGGVSSNYPAAHFIMHSGTISGNESTSSSGGGAHIAQGGVFRMYGGTIKENTAQNAGGAVLTNNVHPRRSRFYMFGGTIESNIATIGHGGGVSVTQQSYFYMHNNASIQRNRAFLEGGGVNLDNNARFYMHNTASIYGNRAGTATGNQGGGVRATGTTFFTMNGSTTIHGNAAGGNGGGVVLLASTTFTMNGSPSILNNIAGAVISPATPAIPGPFNPGNITGFHPSSGNGGGVHIGGGSSTFHMNGGLIAGNEAWIGGGVNAGGTSGDPTLVNIAVGSSIRGGLGFASTPPYNHARSTAPATQDTHAIHRTNTREITLFGATFPFSTTTVFSADLP